jgi:MoaA/NifB/PqqE/SkfB family radical SAM enzyme
MIQKIKTIYKNLSYMNFLRNHPRVYWKLAKGYTKVNFLKCDQVRFVEIMLTHGCNAKCFFCSCRALLERSGRMLDEAKIKTVIDECAKMDVPVIAFLGGEPLLVKYLPSLLAHTKKRGILPGITTNASLLTKEKLKDLKDAGLGFMSVSIHSTDPKEHDALLKIDNLFEHAMEMLREAKRLGIACNIATVFMRDMFEDGRYERLVNLAKENNFRISVNNFVPASQDDLDSPQMLTLEQNKKLESLCKEHTFITTHMTNNFFGYGCPIGNCYIGLSAFGDALPCFFVPISFGNVWNDSMQEVFKKMTKVPFFKRRPQMCMAGENKEFINEYLKPTFGRQRGSPMEVENHPKYDKCCGTLMDINESERCAKTNV